MSPQRPSRPRLTVRASAALAAIAVLLPVLCVVLAVGVVVQRGQLRDNVAVLAEEQARSVARSVVVDGTDSTSIPPLLGGEETVVQVVDGDGTVVAASQRLRGHGPLVGPPAGSVSTTVVDTVPGEEHEAHLVVAVPVAAGAGRYVVTARSLETVEAASRSTALLGAAGIPLVVALVAALSWLLAGRALRPVEALRRQVAGVTTSATPTRLPVPATSDEVERLARTMNEMLARLEASAAVQRQFVADASHELRSPVATIRTVMEVLPPSGATWEEARDDVLAETLRLERLVRDLLVLARRDAGERREQLAEVRLLDVVAEELGRPRRAEVTRLVRGDPVVVGDRRALAVALANLVANADRHAREVVLVSLDVDGDDAVLRVTDDGNGVPPEDAERIFERFVRLDEARTRDAGGAGLGLAIARAVCLDHGGSLRVEDDGGPGATLVLRLPLLRA